MNPFFSFCITENRTKNFVLYQINIFYVIFFPSLSFSFFFSFDICVCARAFFACTIDDAQTVNGAMRNVTRKKRKGRNERKVFQDFSSSFMLLDVCSACET